VVKVEGVSGGVISVSGVDMCHGTPVLDVKPYVPADFIPDYITPAWVTAEDVPKWELQIEPTAEARLTDIIEEKRSPFYRSFEEFRDLLRDVLLQDVRGVHQGRGRAQGERKADVISQLAPYVCNIDDIAIEFWTGTEAIRVTDAYPQLKIMDNVEPDEPAVQEEGAGTTESL
jgi:tRNA (adenine37-N6)-methyltransferase